MKTNSVNAISTAHRRITRSGSAPISAPERTSDQRQRLMLTLVRAVSEIAGVEESAIWVYLCNLAPDDMVEYGRVLPPPGKEQEWFEALPPELQRYLTSIRMQNGKIAK